MSTKIYNGFRFTTANWSTIHQTIMDFRRQMQPFVKTGILKVMAKLATFYVDSVTFNLRSYEKYDSPYLYAQKIFSERVRKILNPFCERDPVVDFTCDISILPGASSRKILGILYADKKEFMEEWLKLPIVEDYSYWDNSDPDPSVSPRSWKQRQKDWDKALAYFCDIPAMNGFSAQIVSRTEFFIVDIEGMLKHISANENRARTVAIEILYKEKKFKDQFFSFYKWQKSSEGQLEIRKKVKEILPKVVSIDKKLILNDFPRKTS